MWLFGDSISYLKIETKISVGYAGGTSKNPKYEELKSGNPAKHAEVVRIVYYPDKISYHEILKLFFENHNPTEKNRQGIDIGTQYRSVIFAQNDDQLKIANNVKDLYQKQLEKSDDMKFKSIVTEVHLFLIPRIKTYQRYV